MHTLSSLLLLSSASTAWGYAWVARQPGVDSSLLHAGRYANEKRANQQCPFNANHPGAAPYSDKYPYSGAKNGVPGNQKGGIKVPADGDTAHQYTAPGEGDIRGPCPGLNTAANHNFLSHDGITNFAELVDAQQNLYNVGYDLAALLAVLGIQADGDLITTKLSIGCDATSRTATLPLLGRQPGLNQHLKFEGDTSLTRNDYFLADGDNFSFNGSLFAEMKEYADSVSGGLFDRESISAYRSQRYDESVRNNPNFFFGPLSLLLFGAASFLYELFPSFGPDGPADLATMKSFFGAVEDDSAPGGWRHVPERIPDNWFNRKAPYMIKDVGSEIFAQYSRYPKLFGGNVGADNFDALPGVVGLISGGQIPDAATAGDFVCLLYMLATEDVPSTLSTTTDITQAALDFALPLLIPGMKNAGCPIPVFDQGNGTSSPTS